MIAAQPGTAEATSPSPLVAMRGITKQYPGVRALDRVDFDLEPGEVHILFGENGAGKSTLISLLSGAQQPNEGEIRLAGQAIDIPSVHRAREVGICAVFQEFSLVPQMTVEENIFLGDEVTRHGLLRKAELQARAGEILQRLKFPLDPGRRVRFLTRAEQQMVEIAKAFRSEPKILILDEPTASLTDHETERLFDLIERLKNHGVGIIYITHRIGEITRIGDRVTVLRDGRTIATVAATTAEEELVRLMTGRVVDEIFPRIQVRPGAEILTVDDLATEDARVNGATLTVRSGEIVGLAGLVGSGKSRTGQAVFGAARPARGTIRFKGENVTGRRPAEMMERGVLYLPANRRDDGLVMMRSCRENMSLAALGCPPLSNGWLLDRAAEQRQGRQLAARLNLSPPRIERRVDQFSGGNQQKVMLARALTRPFELFIFDEPTVGVDVGTRTAIYRFIADLCEAGAAILLISSDLPEILHLSHRIHVFHRGRVRAELQQDEISEAAVLTHFFEREAG